MRDTGVMQLGIVTKAALAALAVASLGPVFAQQTPAQQRMVVVISLDGFPAYALEDAKLPIPTLRRLIREGVTARMNIINPTVTWPNHTTMVTGVKADEHGLLVNGSLVPTGTWPPIKTDPMVDKVKMVHAPTVYDAAHKAGLTTAQIDWVAISNAPTITWPFNEWATPEGPVEKEMISKGVITVADVTDFTKANILFRDQIWAKAADLPDPRTQTQFDATALPVAGFGAPPIWAKSLAANSAMAFLDSCVEKVVTAVREAGMQDRTTFLIVADHGFKGYTKDDPAGGCPGGSRIDGQGSRDTRGRHGDDLCARQSADSAGGEGVGRGGGRGQGGGRGRIRCDGPSDPRQGSADEPIAAHGQRGLLVLGRHRGAGDGRGAATAREPRICGERSGSGCTVHRSRVTGFARARCRRRFPTSTWRRRLRNCSG